MPSRRRPKSVPLRIVLKLYEDVRSFSPVSSLNFCWAIAPSERFFLYPFQGKLGGRVLSTEGFTLGFPAKPRMGLMEGSPGPSPGSSGLTISSFPGRGYERSTRCQNRKKEKTTALVTVKRRVRRYTSGGRITCSAEMMPEAEKEGPPTDRASVSHVRA